MTQGERVKTIRKKLELTLEKFGGRLGVGKTAISKIEKGENNLTEQMLLSICREFRVNYYWLTKEEEPMFVGTPADVVDEIAEDYNLDDFEKKILEKYLALPEDQRCIIKNYLKSIFT